MEQCGRCIAEGRKPEIKGVVHRVNYNGITVVMCNLCYTEFQDEVGDIIYSTDYYENEED